MFPLDSNQLQFSNSEKDPKSEQNDALPYQKAGYRPAVYIQHRLHILQQEYMENSNMRIHSWKQAYQCQSHISRYQ